MNSQISPADQHSDIFRGIFSFFDRPAYWLLTIIYQIFFNVASADLFANETIMNFFGRVQLIIGVYMMFQLAMTILIHFPEYLNLAGKSHLFKTTIDFPLSLFKISFILNVFW